MTYWILADLQDLTCVVVLQALPQRHHKIDNVADSKGETITRLEPSQQSSILKFLTDKSRSDCAGTLRGMSQRKDLLSGGCPQQ